MSTRGFKDTSIFDTLFIYYMPWTVKYDYKLYTKAK